jgi:hypothetical protein
MMFWGSFTDKNRKISYTYKAERRITMNKGTRNQLEVKLKKMLNHFDQIKAKQKQPIPQPGIGNIIRRRAGEKEKRFSYCI